MIDNSDFISNRSFEEWVKVGTNEGRRRISESNGLLLTPTVGRQTITVVDKTGGISNMDLNLYREQQGIKKDWEFVSITSYIADQRRNIIRDNKGKVQCIDKKGKYHVIDKTLYDSQVGPKTEWEFIAHTSPEARNRKLEIYGFLISDPISRRRGNVPCVDKNGTTCWITVEEYNSQFGEYSDREYVSSSSKEGKRRRAIITGQEIKIDSRTGKTNVINKSGKTKSMDSNAYRSQVGDMSDWEWVSVQTTEGKRRKIIK